MNTSDVFNRKYAKLEDGKEGKEPLSELLPQNRNADGGEEFGGQGVPYSWSLLPVPTDSTPKNEFSEGSKETSRFHPKNYLLQGNTQDLTGYDSNRAQYAYQVQPELNQHHAYLLLALK